MRPSIRRAVEPAVARRLAEALFDLGAMAFQAA
jgi:hypothetical protein